jgi:hypothetical protein
MSVGTTKSFPKELDKSIDDIFFNSYTEAPAMYEMTANVIPSFEGKEIRVSELSGIGAMRTVSEGHGVHYDTLIEGNEVGHEPTQYGLGFQITQIMWEDDGRHKNIRAASKELGLSAAYKRETVYWDLLNNGFATHTAWDGNYIFVSSGRTVLKGSSTNNNRPSSDAELSETSFNAANEYYMKVVGSSGRPIDLSLNLLMVPVELDKVAWQLHQNVNSPGTMDNDLNTLKRLGKWKPMTVRHLTSSTAWFTMSGEIDLRPKFVWKRNITLRNSDDFDTDNMLYKAMMRFMCYVDNPIGLYGTTGA